MNVKLDILDIYVNRLFLTTMNAIARMVVHVVVLIPVLCAIVLMDISENDANNIRR